jgi:hypothetical protein
MTHGCADSGTRRPLAGIALTRETE